jgi:hypothetical protein
MNWRSSPKVVAVILALGLVSACNPRQLSPNWNGTWKLNPSRGNFQGPIITISISADGEYRYDDGNSSFTFRCDGKDRPIPKNRTLACVKSSAAVLNLTQKREDGVKTNAYHWELSADGKVLTATATEFGPSGPAVKGQIVSSRLSGSNDFAGKWQDKNFLRQHADMTLRLDTQAMHISYPSAGQYLDATFDGTDTAVHGLHAPEGVVACAARLVGQRKILYFTKSNGKVQQHSLELSNDGRVVTQSWWDPDRPGGKGTLVYEKN